MHPRNALLTWKNLGLVKPKTLMENAIYINDTESDAYLQNNVLK